jgi:hypothetical protein
VALACGAPLCPLPVCQWDFVVVFFVVSQVGHNSVSFLAAIFIIDNQWTPYA